MVVREKRDFFFFLFCNQVLLGAGDEMRRRGRRIELGTGPLTEKDAWGFCRTNRNRDGGTCRVF